MRKTTKLGALGAGGVAGLALAGAALLPANADTGTEDTTTTQQQPALTDRVTRLREALAGLVEDGTLTQDAADTVAQTLAESDALRSHAHGGRGAGGIALDTAAETLGLSAEELRDQLAAGATLADVA